MINTVPGAMDIQEVLDNTGVGVSQSGNLVARGSAYAEAAAP